MLKLVSGLDGASGNFCIQVTSPLVEQYFPNLCGMMKNDKLSPSGLTVEKIGPSTALIQFPSGAENSIIGEPEDGRIRISPEAAQQMNNVLNIARRFAAGAIRSISKKTEFIPILDFHSNVRDYSLEEMQSDVIEAMKNKRNLVIIDNFQAYIDNNTSMKYEFNQHLIDFEKNKSEYADFVLLVKAGKLDEIRKLYKNKLKKTSWF